MNRLKKHLRNYYFSEEHRDEFAYISALYLWENVSITVKNQQCTLRRFPEDLLDTIAKWMDVVVDDPFIHELATNCYVNSEYSQKFSHRLLHWIYCKTMWALIRDRKIQKAMCCYDKYEIIPHDVFSGEFTVHYQTQSLTPIYERQHVTTWLTEAREKLIPNAKKRKWNELFEYKPFELKMEIQTLQKEKEDMEYVLTLLKNNIKENRNLLAELEQKNQDLCAKLPDSDAKKDVYFIRDTVTRKIKIGVSNNVEVRLSTLERELKHKLRLLGIIPYHGFSLEKELHTRFAETRTNGEWFAPSSGLMEFICEYTS